MNSPRRGLLSRFGIRSTRSRDLPTQFERFDLHISIDDDTASVHTILPAYSPRSNLPLSPPLNLPLNLSFNRPPSPAPTYYTVDERETTPTQIIKPHPNVIAPSTQINPQPIIDEIVNRLHESIKNPKSWRLHSNGKKSFFWALRCAPGTVDILNENVNEIRRRIMGTRDWKVEKFCLLYRGQKLGDLWCRPIRTDVMSVSLLQLML